MTIMPSQIIPKERLSACQRWEMDAFEPEVSVSAEPRNQKQEGAKEPAAVILPTVEQIERIHQQAKQEGHAAGYEAGFKAGHEAGSQAGHEQATAEAAKLQGLLHSFQRELRDADQTVANDLLALALGLAKQMVREALRVKPELMFALVRECMQHDDAFSQPVQLFLHPEDAALVREHLQHELNDCTVCIDAKLERGSCRMRMGNSQIDATLATRWQRIAQALGQNSNWLE